MSDDQQESPSPSKRPAVLTRRAVDVEAAQRARAEQVAKIEAAAKAAEGPLTADHVNEGDVLWIRMRDTKGHEQSLDRPWIVISRRSRAHRRADNLVIAVPLTKQVHKIEGFRKTRIAVPPEFITTTDDRFKQIECLALPEHVRSLSLERCDGRVGSVDPSIVSSVRGAVRYLLGM